MEDLLEKCCGLDVHKNTIVACMLSGPLGQKTTAEIREFSTLNPDLHQLKDWILGEDCHFVAMESTGIYWQPIYEILEDSVDKSLTLLVVNARHMKNVPGKKTDTKDSEWIASLLRAGLLRGSFIPDKQVREFRHLTRYRKNVIREVTAQKNRIEKFLQSSGFRLSSFISDIFGASGMNIIHHLIEFGGIDRDSLDQCLKTKTRKHIDEILIAVNGQLSIHQQRFLQMLMSHLEMIRAHLKEVEQSIDQEIFAFSKQIDLLTSIPGIALTAAATIIAEIGGDMAPFKTAEHICSWAGLSPGNNESAGKRKSVAITKGNPYIKSMLCEVAWVIAGKRNSYLSTWYWKIKQRKGAKKAIIALARKLLVIIYTMLKTEAYYDETVFEQRRVATQQKKTSLYVKALEKQGYVISPPA
ncbi:IS110 family transposase [Enterococcus sp. 665A]|uniref:IS110 family transposase n=1 Tax=Candidatus Enterococcus ferrettii TaxID=2815324 RepID=A0ABV0EPX2_9ENTE|nr:IS110 family transposase [Enterococcus sp. 665A]